MRGEGGRGGEAGCAGKKGRRREAGMARRGGAAGGGGGGDRVGVDDAGELGLRVGAGQGRQQRVQQLAVLPPVAVQVHHHPHLPVGHVRHLLRRRAALGEVPPGTSVSDGETVRVVMIERKERKNGEGGPSSTSPTNQPPTISYTSLASPAFTAGAAAAAPTHHSRWLPWHRICACAHLSERVCSHVVHAVVLAGLMIASKGQCLHLQTLVRSCGKDRVAFTFALVISSCIRCALQTPRLEHPHVSVLFKKHRYCCMNVSSSSSRKSSNSPSKHCCRRDFSFLSFSSF